MNDTTWRRRGTFLHAREGDDPRTHPQSPTVLPLDGGLWRVYYSARDARNVARTFAVDVDPEREMRVVASYDEPVLSCGERGAFDHFGLGPACAFRGSDGRVWLYYTGVTTRTDVPYETAIGLATSVDGLSFERAAVGPVFTKGPYDPYFVSSPTVRRVADAYDMWYVGAHAWSDFEGRVEPSYEIRHTRSRDGIVWDAATTVALRASDLGAVAIGRPFLGQDGANERLWFSVRGDRFRNGGPDSYRIWSAPLQASGTVDARAAVPARFEDSPQPDDWDALMQAYACVGSVGDTRYMLYNGNDFGRYAIGWASGSRV